MRIETFEQLIILGAGRQFSVSKAHQRKARNRYLQVYLATPALPDVSDSASGRANKRGSPEPIKTNLVRLLRSRPKTSWGIHYY